MEFIEIDKNLEKLVDAVAYAVENNATHIVQRYFVQEEYMGETESTSYDVDNVENCTYSFFHSFDDAEAFRKFGVWSNIVGSHQVTLDVKAYLDYYGQQNPVSDRVKKLISRRTEKNDELPF